ncbi:hypothetical protein FRC01_013352, partial [Tulasnella sp. 417]
AEDILNGLQYLHNMDPPAVHGNLKPSNILIHDDGRALLSDYGLADDQMDRSMGVLSKRALRWSSPEVLSGEPPTAQSDVWSWACVILEMVTGHRPYEDFKADGEIIALLSADEETRRPPEPVSVHPSVPSDLIKLLQRCWDFDPWGRPDVWQCADAINSMSGPESNRGQSDCEEMLRWLDQLIVGRYIPAVEAAMREYISMASKDPELVEASCPVSGRSRSDLEGELLWVQELRRQSREVKADEGLQDYLELQADRVEQARDLAPRPPEVNSGKTLEPEAPSDPPSIAPILRIPFDCTREEIGVTLRELHSLAKAELLPQLHDEGPGAILDEFEAAISYYPDCSHQEVVDFLMGSLYEDYLQHGESVVQPTTLAQLMAQWRGLSDAEEDALKLLSNA